MVCHQPLDIVHLLIRSAVRLNERRPVIESDSVEADDSAKRGQLFALVEDTLQFVNPPPPHKPAVCPGQEAYDELRVENDPPECIGGKRIDT